MNTQWADEIQKENLMEYVRNIARWERIAGSAEEAAAFDYIQKTLNGFGVKTTLHHHKAFISMPVAATLTVGGQSFFCRTHSHAANTEGLRAKLVKVDKGSMNEEVCRGNIVMFEGRALREPIIAIGKLGAVGIVCVPGDVIAESCVTPVWGSPDHEELDMMPKTPVVSIDSASMKDICKLLDQDVNDAQITAKIDHSWRDIPLLVAEIPSGKKKTDKFVMFSGHVDSWYYGATDNGTANCVMMEVCRVAVAHKDEMERNLRIVFFSGHSQGRYAGSAWYSDAFWEDITENCQASINADVLGITGGEDLTPAATMPELKNVVAEAVMAQTGITYKGSRYSRFADQSFWGTGVSCALASFSKIPPRTEKDTYPKSANPPLGWWWHTPEDTLDKIDPENFLRDARVFSRVLQPLVCQGALPLKLSAAAKEAVDNLEAWQQKAGDAFDLSLPLQRARELYEKLVLLEAKRPGCSSPAAEICAYNAALYGAGRSLVRVNYTRGNDYKNDPSVAQPPMPALRAINELAGADEHLRNALLISLTRSRNYVAYMLKSALDAVNPLV